MKFILIAILALCGVMADQQVDTDVIPTTPGLNPGHPNRPWNGFFQNITITGTCLYNGAPCLGGGTVTGAFTGGGLVLSGNQLGLRIDCGVNQIEQWNGTSRVCATPSSGVTTGVSVGSQLVSNGSSQPPVYQAKPVIDVRDYYVAGTAASTTTTGTNAPRTTINIVSCTGLLANSGVNIAGAGVAGAQYVGTISSCSGTVLTVSPATSTSVRAGAAVSADDTVAFQNAVNAACGPQYVAKSGSLVIPNNGTSGMLIGVSSSISIKGCGGLTVDGSGNAGSTPFFTTIQWIGANGSTSPVLSINRTRDSTFKNLIVGTSTGPGANQTTVAVDIDESGSGNWITTNNHFENILAVSASPANANFVGFRLGATAPGNVEDMSFEHTQVTCGGAAPTGLNTNGIGYLIEGPSGAEPFYTYIHNSQVINCSRGWDLADNNRLVIINGGLTNGNYYVLYDENGAQTVIKNIRDEGSTFFAAMLSTATDLTVDNVSLSGLTPGNTSFDMTNSGGTSRLYVSHTQWDNVAVTPISLMNHTILFANTYPAGACPNYAIWGVEFSDTNSTALGVPCPNVKQDNASRSNIVSSTTLGGVQGSPFSDLCGSYQNSGNPTYAPDCWDWQDIVGSGLNGTSTLTLTRSGSSGANAIDLTAASTTKMTAASVTGQITSTLATGTAPFSVASTTNVPNLNASSLSGATFGAPGAIGGTAPAAVTATTYSTATNCAVNSASPAACGSAASGAVVIPTTTTTYTVNTTAVTAHSRIMLQWLSFASDLPSSPTCVPPVATTEPTISAVVAGTSFTIALGSTTGQTCPMFTIVN